MKAIRYHAYGDRSVLSFEDAPAPEAGPGQVVVQLAAAGVNHLDVWVREGVYGARVPMPHIGGSDGAGVVAKVGPGVRRVKEGDQVAISPGLSCGVCRECLSGRDNLCPQYVIIGAGPDGTYAQQVAVPEANLLVLPARLSAVQAAALPLVLVTAWHMLVGLAKIRPGETVLVLGGTSGVGSMAVQVAKLFGAQVIATAQSAKLDQARTIGADLVIDHSQEDIAQRVRELTQKRGVDIVFEHIGEATWEASLKSLRPGGRLVTCGSTTGHQAMTDLRYLYSRQLSIFGDYMGSKGELQEAWRWVEDGRIQPVIDRTFPLAEAQAAHQHLEERRAVGKVVLAIEA
ncbi:MAG: zinc-binding dehydrogenase [Sulfobacillus sp.]